jgi:hypothetical protein
VGARTRSLWPFTGIDFEHASDPINILFAGRADPRSLRAALLALDGDRTAFGFPNFPPFNCTWSDAIGALQTGWSENGWSASAVQLQCGAYGPVRFHVRLFATGDLTLGNAHFEVLIPGTTDHEVISWELAQQLLTVDMIRTGLLDTAAPFSLTGVINPAPSYRTINPLVYNGLPAALIAAIGGPAAPVTAPVPLPSDGRATVFTVASPAAITAGVAESEFTIMFGQVIPKPFCASGPLDFVRVDGPVLLKQTVSVTAGGDYAMQADIHGRLLVTPVDPRTSPPAPIGEAYDAEVVERYEAMITDDDAYASMFQMRALLPVGDPFGGRLQTNLRVGAGGSTDFVQTIRCGAT